MVPFPPPLPPPVLGGRVDRVGLGIDDSVGLGIEVVLPVGILVVLTGLPVLLVEVECLQ